MAWKGSSSLLAVSSRACNYTSRNWHPQQISQYPVTSDVLLGDSQTSSDPKIKCHIRTAVLLNRSPTLTRTPTPFEATLHEYNARIARALFNPFPVEFYFKAGSVLEKKFMREESQREEKAFKRKTPVSEDTNHNTGEDDGSSKGVGIGVLGKEEGVAIMSRSTEADRKGNVKSLDRKGHRNLYLLVKKKGKGHSEWKLPGGVGDIQQGESLHEAAKRELHAECGLNMDAWIVGRHPIAFVDDPIPPNSPLSEGFVEAKAHILAGQVDPSVGSLADFAWLTKREVKRAVTPEYWTNIRDILSDF